MPIPQSLLNPMNVGGKLDWMRRWLLPLISRVGTTKTLCVPFFPLPWGLVFKRHTFGEICAISGRTPNKKPWMEIDRELVINQLVVLSLTASWQGFSAAI